MAYGGLKDLTRGTTYGKILRDKAFNIANNLKSDGHQRDLASMVYKLFYKATFGSGIENENTWYKRPSNLTMRHLVEELQKPIIKKFEKRKVQSPFIDNICGADLADMQLISFFIMCYSYL